MDNIRTVWLAWADCSSIPIRPVPLVDRSRIFTSAAEKGLAVHFLYTTFSTLYVLRCFVILTLL